MMPCGTTISSLTQNIPASDTESDRSKPPHSARWSLAAMAGSRLSISAHGRPPLARTCRLRPEAAVRRHCRPIAGINAVRIRSRDRRASDAIHRHASHCLSPSSISTAKQDGEMAVTWTLMIVATCACIATARRMADSRRRSPQLWMWISAIVGLRWSRPFGQFGGRVKLGSGCRQAASLSIAPVPYASSGVRPPNVECGRRVL